MKLSSFSENIVKVPYQRSGETVILEVNIDALLPEYYEVLEKRLEPLLLRVSSLQKRFDEQQKRIKANKKVARPITTLQLEKEAIKIEREANVERLTSPVELPDGSTTTILKGWDLQSDDGMPLALNKDSLLKLPPRAVQEMWELCLKAATTVKKREDEETEETTDNTLSGSKALRVVGQPT